MKKTHLLWKVIQSHSKECAYFNGLNLPSHTWAIHALCGKAVWHGGPRNSFEFPHVTI